MSLPSLCEFVWVLRRVYKFERQDIEAALAGLTVFKAGGDLADGLIAHEGRWLGADTFVSFDASAGTCSLGRDRTPGC